MRIGGGISGGAKEERGGAGGGEPSRTVEKGARASESVAKKEKKGGEARWAGRETEKKRKGMSSPTVRKGGKKGGWRSRRTSHRETITQMTYVDPTSCVLEGGEGTLLGQVS